MIKIKIDDKELEVREGERVLWAALEAGIYIPHLCAHKESDHHPASCRLCWVEIEGKPGPVCACAEIAQPGMVVRTRSEAVDRLTGSGFELLMSTHRLDCGKCAANQKCALQNISKKLKLPLRPKRLPKIEPNHPLDESHPALGIDPNHCVLCGRCVHACNRIGRSGVLDFKNRGLATMIGTFDGRPLSEHDCGHCLRCFRVCPVGALYFKKDKPGLSTEKVSDNHEDTKTRS